MNQIVFAFAGVNLIAILYLGLVHQRAPIDVNRAILKTVRAAEKSTLDNIQVHYLMGCHSTPLLSHLHDPPTKFVPLYLDCSPKCRTDPAIDCDSDVFSKDPDAFIKHTYFDSKNRIVNEDDTCTATVDGGRPLGSRSIPDYIVCSSDDWGRMKEHLQLIGMQEIGRFVHGINGVQIGDSLTLGSESFSDPNYSKVELFLGFLTLSFEEIILLERII